MLTQKVPKIHRTKIIILTILSMLLTTLISCRLTDRDYSTDEQWDLARSRVDLMKEQLGFSYTLEKEIVNLGESIFFTVHFTNKTDSPVVVRIPQQAGVWDLDTVNTTLEYSIVPLDKETSVVTPLSSMGGFPFIFSNAVLAGEFTTLRQHAKKDVKLELPNIVYIINGEEWKESKLPPGQYLVNIVYENFQIGYEVDRKDEIRTVDVSAWVGEITSEPVLLTVLP